MKHLGFLSLLCGMQALASTHAITEFTYAGGAFFALPFEGEYWVQVEDDKQVCWKMYNEFGSQQEPEGARVYDSRRGDVYFLSVTGGYYKAKAGADHFDYVAPGDTAGGTQWVRTDHGVQQRLAWQSQNVWFVQDPRTEHAKNWYQLGPGLSCHVFTESTRSYGPADLQTVTLSSGVEGIPAWTISTGRATLGLLEEKGNWVTK